MPTLHDTSTFNTVGSIDAYNSPPSIDAPDHSVGDIIFVAVFWAQGVGTTGNYTPSGFTRLTEFGSSSVRQGAVYAAIVETENQFAAGITLRSGATSTRVAAVAWTYSPVGDEMFEIVGLSASALEWNGSTMSSDTFPAGITGDLVFGISFDNKAASETLTVHSGVGGATEIAQVTAPAALSGSVSDSSTSVWLGGTGVSFNIAQANGLTYSIGVTIGTQPPTSPDGIPLKIGDGTQGYLTVLDGSSARVVPNSLRRFYPGFATIAAMDAQDGATWAHRGGSSSYPEKSEFAYDSAIMRGYGVLEFSVRRSSDGVWFGLHDATLARTSENAGLTADVSTMTWAEIQAYQITLNAGTQPRPYFTLEDFLTKYTNHILMIENKTGLNNTSEYLPTLLAVDNAVNRIIVKLDGSFLVARFQEAKAAGFKVAGYWYDDYATKLPDREEYTDYIGMPLASAQGLWDDVALYGKPMWGHVATTQANYATARTKGAKFVQCGAVADIAPVGPVIN